MEREVRTALITGSCGEGMGRSTAFRLAREGMNIVLNYGTHRRGQEVQADAARIADAVRELGGRAIVQPADTTDEGQVVAMVEAAQKAFGGIDILVNNAGGEWDVRDYAEIELEHWRSVLSAEIDGAFLTMKHVVPGMRVRGWGRIVHIGLDGALQSRNVRNVAPDYALGKAARAWMAAALGSQEFGKGITVNCIAPGPTAHMSFEGALQAARGDHSAWQERERVTCHDIAEAVAFLCSEAGRMISGSTICFPMRL